VIGSADWFALGILNSSSAWTFFKEECLALGDKDEGGRLRLKTQYIENLPIPDATVTERTAVSESAKQAQALHSKRRARVEQFLREIGMDPAQSTSRNPLEQPWSLTPAEFGKRAPRQPIKRYEAAREETAALTEQIAKVEAEIDARVAALYGLDAEDQRWAAKAASAGQPDDKQALFFRVLSGLKERNAYFRYEDIQILANKEEFALKDSSLKVYLNEALNQGLIHDAGRGWYSRLSEPVPLDPKPVAGLIRAVTKAFPLLGFTACSTAQINPWMHHILAQPTAFLYAEGDALESIGEKLRDLGWQVAINPTPTEGPKAVRPGPKTVVLRPSISKQPEGESHQAPIEKILVDLVAETPKLALMDDSEAHGVAETILSRHLVPLAALQSYAERRGVKLAALEAINQRQSTAGTGDD
jgi:hypothetical protein